MGPPVPDELSESILLIRRRHIGCPGAPDITCKGLIYHS